ncbi:MAG TPA: PEP-CTERM sorting domain-containing protein [Pirellulaceae bacterium]|nr:PEP-CTERM sorting domain-containing protein [Pirellulaceae bacterium]
MSVSAKQWGTYAVAGVAAAGVSAATAEADITHVVVNQASVPGDDFYFALSGGESLNFWHPSLGPGAGAVLLGVFNGALTGSVVGFTAGFNYASNLAVGVNISTQNFLPAFATLAYGNGYANSQFLNAGDGYLAFRFNGGTQYGWARVNMSGVQPGNNYTIVEYAYGSVGTSVAVGQIPEPSSLGLLALGAVGLAAFRRRRETQTAV